MWFGDLHCKHLPVERQPSEISVETHGAGRKVEDYAPPPDMLGLFSLD